MNKESINNKYNPIKVFHFTSAIRRGGKERQVFTIYKYSSERIINKILAIYKSQSTYLAEYSVEDRDIYFLDTRNNFLRVWRYFKIVRKEQPDIIFAWDMLSFLIAQIGRPFFSYRIVNASAQHGIRPHTFLQHLRMFVLQLSNNVIANSKAGLLANKLNRGVVLYNGISPMFYTGVNKRPALDNLKFSNINRPVFISVANLVPYKDYYTVIEALYVLHQQNKNFTYLILGEGPNRKAITDQIMEKGLENKIHLLGTIDNVIDYLQQADIFIHSSKGEGISNAILEAMFSGLPVIASRVGGVPETVCQQYGSMLFEYKDADGLVDCLLRAETEFKDFDPQNLLLQKHLEQFTTKVMIDNYEGIMSKLVQKKPNSD